MPPSVSLLLSLQGLQLCSQHLLPDTCVAVKFSTVAGKRYSKTESREITLF
ncbi:hypothetical protein I79_010868 [Cricetulus griseus]|uniref:Uncharacterized protein n=1 Tax=Cricetulus griseus TaxID=10029 RepID=G3HJM0_CRIGR|nr:hypothetical protein I79_010868 [Cricetulus griseus]